ncbi:MAG TPA: hypothetical protein VKT80_09225, partial [Chloroflexota bacterium]|nr:hypothetical protein [Chloroflexota bacterium]
MSSEPHRWSRALARLLSGVFFLGLTSCAAPTVSPTPIVISPIVRTVIPTGATPKPTRTRRAVASRSPTAVSPVLATATPDSATVVVPEQPQVAGS